MIERDKTVNRAIALCYISGAVVIVAVYREPLRDLFAPILRALKPRVSSVRSIRPLRGKLWSDVKDAIDNAGETPR